MSEPRLIVVRAPRPPNRYWTARCRRGHDICIGWSASALTFGDVIRFAAAHLRAFGGAA